MSFTLSFTLMSQSMRTAAVLGAVGLATVPAAAASLLGLRASDEEDDGELFYDSLTDRGLACHRPRAEPHERLDSERLSRSYAALMAELQEAAGMGVHVVALTPATLMTMCFYLFLQKQQIMKPVLPEGEEGDGWLAFKKGGWL